MGGQTGTDVASVYRNLETLEEVGLVRHFHLGHSPGLYVRAGGGLHEYLVCESCGTVRAVDPDELDGVAEECCEREFGWEAHFTHYPISGCAPTAPGGRGALTFEWLFGPVEHADEWLTQFFDGAPLLVALWWPSCSGCATPRIPTTWSR